MINKTRKQIKTILKRIKKGKTYNLCIIDSFNSFRIHKINDNKYLVSNTRDPLFFDMYKEVIITKHNLINMLEIELNKKKDPS